VSKIDDAVSILVDLGLPRAQQNERSGLTLLALAGLKPRTPWESATAPLLRTVDIMGFIRDVYKEDYAANSRETFRKETLRPFEHARIVDRNPDDPARATNSGKTAYRLSDAALAVIRTFGSGLAYEAAISDFKKRFGELSVAYRSTRDLHRVPLVLPDGKEISLSAGKHNVLQAAIIRDFGPRFAPGARVLYIGDTADKHVILEAATLAGLGVTLTEHDKLPDVVLYDDKRGWLLLIEAVTSHGPVSPKRHRELEAVFSKCAAGRVYVTAFPDAATFRRYVADIAWETEVWLADNPDHMIHFNGDKFLGPYVTR
jgi:hypothetical protein